VMAWSVMHEVLLKFVHISNPVMALFLDLIRARFLLLIIRP